MKEMNQKDLEAVSELLDGEAGDEAALRARLERDPAFAARYRAYARLSNRLKQLQEVRVNPSLATRVIAAVEHEARRRAFRWGPVVVAAAAMVLVLTGVVIWSVAGYRTAPTSPFALEPEYIEAELEARLAESPESQPAEWASPFAAFEEVGPPSIDTVLLVEINEMIDEQSDIDELLQTLSADEATALREMLLAYAMEG